MVHNPLTYPGRKATRSRHRKEHMLPVEYLNLNKKPKQTTPLKINMEHSHGGLEDHFPF